MILKPAHLTFPLDTDLIFGRSGPLILEIGFGDGFYLAHLANIHPEWNLLGVEISMGSIWRAYRRMKREKAEAVRLFHGNARFFLRDVLAPNALQGIYVNFPDPWPRKKHWPNRLLNQSFFELASKRLLPGCPVALTTDDRDYFDFAVNECRKSNLYEVEKALPPEQTLQTKYALKWRAKEKNIYHVLFKKTGEASFTPAHVQLATMQHAVLEGDLNKVGDFSKLVRSIDGGQVVVLEAFREMGGSGLLFKMLVEELDLRQEVIVQAFEKSDGIYVGLQQFGDPLGTRGIKEGVRLIVEWLEEQGFTLKESWI